MRRWVEQAKSAGCQTGDTFDNDSFPNSRPAIFDCEGYRDDVEDKGDNFEIS